MCGDPPGFLMVYWACMEYQRSIRNRQIERAKKLLKDLDPETYKKGPHDVTRFIKRTSCTESGEAVMDSYEIDQAVFYLVLLVDSIFYPDQAPKLHSGLCIP